MAFSVRGRVSLGLGLLAFGASLGGACSGGSSGLGSAEGGASNGGSNGKGECRSNDDCDEDSICRDGECVTSCRSDKDCRATDQLCGDDDVCVDCLTDSHCDAGQTCSDAGECRGPGSGSGGVPNGSGEGGAPNATDGGRSGGGTLNEAGMPGMTGEAGSSNTGDCQLAPIDPCAGLPHFSGSQAVDGDDTEFCTIAPFTLALASTPYYRSPKPPIGSATSATARVAWSATALHVFIRVIDATPYPNSKSSLLYIWDGDNVELFASPKTPTGTFNYARSYDYGAFQVIAAPPGGAYYPSGQAAFTSTGYASAVPGSQVHLALTATGYTVEAQIPWTDAAPIANTPMGFDMGLSDDFNGLNATLTDYRDHYGLLYNASLAVGTCTTYYEPYCDSRNWCTPTALP